MWSYLVCNVTVSWMHYCCWLGRHRPRSLKRAAMPSHGDIQRGKPSARWAGAMSSEYWLMGWRCMWLGMVCQSLNLLAWLTNQK